MESELRHGLTPKLSSCDKSYISMKELALSPIHFYSLLCSLPSISLFLVTLSARLSTFYPSKCCQYFFLLLCTSIGTRIGFFYRAGLHYRLFSDHALIGKYCSTLIIIHSFIIDVRMYLMSDSINYLIIFRSSSIGCLGMLMSSSIGYLSIFTSLILM